MYTIELPISKSIVNRMLVLQAIHRDPLMEVSAAMPEDIRTMHDALVDISRGAEHIDIHNCGTAMRFLTAYCAQLPACRVVLDGSERMRQRPIGPLVEALRTCGADIQYIGQKGYPPLRIQGKTLQPQKVVLHSPLSTQFVSALMLIGIPVQTRCASPYLSMTAMAIQAYPHIAIEKDWSSAAFWYEYVALHGGQLCLKGLYQHSCQADRVVATIFRHLGVETLFEQTGIVIQRTLKVHRLPLCVSFQSCPDLYPAVALTCRLLHKPLWAWGTGRLPYKESNRLQSVRTLQTNADHRMAMALLAADRPCDDRECTRKSYPAFVEQLAQVHSLFRSTVSDSISCS